MPTQPVINRTALIAVKHATTGSLPLGRGGIFTGSFSADGFALVDVSTGADGQVDCVIVESTPDDKTVGYVVIVGQSMVQLRIGTNPVTKRDKLNLQDTSGVWKTATTGETNVYYVALQNAAANSLCWAIPCASRPF